MRLLLIHGRSQGGRKAEDLKRAWLEAAQVGLQARGRSLPHKIVVDFPYYGDLLDELTARADLPSPADIVAKGPGEDRAFAQFQRDVLYEMQSSRGITEGEIEASLLPSTVREKGPQNWPLVLAIARLVDERLTPGSSFTIEKFLRDVFLYISRPGVRDAIDATVEEQLTGEPMVVVAHSLGTIVAYNILRKHRKQLKVRKFVTLGSPLGIRAISAKLGVIENPAAKPGWYNAYDRRDIVALNPLSAPFFGVAPKIQNYGEVRNHTLNRHGIAGYLDDPGVAAAVLDGFG